MDPQTRGPLDPSTYTPPKDTPVAPAFTDKNILVYEMYTGPNKTLRVAPLMDRDNNLVVKTHLEDVRHVLLELLKYQVKHTPIEDEGLMENGRSVSEELNNGGKLFLYPFWYVENHVVYNEESMLNQNAVEFIGMPIGSVHYVTGCKAFLVLHYYTPTNHFSLVLHVHVDKGKLCESVITYLAYEEIMEFAESHVREKLDEVDMGGIPLGLYLEGIPIPHSNPRTYRPAAEINFGPSTNQHLESPIVERCNPEKNVLPGEPWPDNAEVCPVCREAVAVVKMSSCRHRMCIACLEMLTRMVCPSCRTEIEEWWVAPPDSETT